MQLLPRTALAVAILCVSGVQAQTGEREAASPAPVAGKPTLTLPPQVLVTPGQPFRVKVESNCTALRYSCPGVVVIPREWLSEPKLYFSGVAPAASGTYTLTVTGTLGELWADATCLVICGAPGPPGPPPNPPGPGPTPPPGPPPSGPLADELRALYAKEPAATRSHHAAILTGVYTAAKECALNDTEITNVGQMFGRVKGTGRKMLGESALLSLRTRIAQANTERFPSDAQPLDAATRKAASEWFASIALILESLK